VAVNAIVRPMGIEGSAGVTAMETSVAGVTVSLVFPEMAPTVAVISDMPGATVVARPEGAMVANELWDEDHTDVDVMFWTVPSE
jgi:hypothetical protein